VARNNAGGKEQANHYRERQRKVDCAADRSAFDYVSRLSHSRVRRFPEKAVAGIGLARMNAAIFEEMGFHYVDPIDGHDFDQPLPALIGARDFDADPILIRPSR
jgi:deoxyxylulose-5-phosphate synthase